MRFYAQSEGFVFFRPREGYELHPLIFPGAEGPSEKVTVPVRGKSCILKGENKNEKSKSYRPREGEELHHSCLPLPVHW